MCSLVPASCARVRSFSAMQMGTLLDFSIAVRELIFPGNGLTYANHMCHFHPQPFNLFFSHLAFSSGRKNFGRNIHWTRYSFSSASEGCVLRAVRSPERKQHSLL